ncbi:ankyrin repeat domain-containing protein [Carnobacterium gallinarum]|uniref:ankyrin repeat domain-containing protein n=1 Tax=Carnobacterium gallinarum TaxID=2749 RepID=UPI000558B95C|nr:ankyrin repeat domain-containing protein [Carnobacterium gallinarum]
MNGTALEANLLEAVNKENQHEVEALFAQRAAVNCADEFGQSPLMLAVKKNNLTLVNVLLAQGADPNQRDNTQLSPFICAAANGRDEMVTEMIAHGADLPSVNRFGGTALLPSSEKGFIRTVEICLEAGVPVNHVNRLGWSALLEAVILGDGGILYQNIIRELLEHGADSLQKDFDNKTPLDYAVERGQTEVVALINGTATEVPVFVAIRTAIKKNQFKEANTLLSEVHLHEINLQKKWIYYQGYLAERMKENEKAVSFYQEGLIHYPEFAFYLANMYRKINQPEKVLATYDKAIAASQDYFFRYHKSNFLRDQGRHEEALVEMDQLVATYPDRTDFYFHQANSFRSSGHHQAAIKAMDEAIKRQPTNPLFSEHRTTSEQLLKS